MPKTQERLHIIAAELCEQLDSAETSLLEDIMILALIQSAILVRMVQSSQVIINDGAR